MSISYLYTFEQKNYPEMASIIWRIQKTREICYNLQAYMQKKQDIEVVIIRKTRYFLYSFLLLAAILCLPTTARAADGSSRAGIVATASGRLSVRQAPSTSAAVLTGLPKGTLITLISRSGDWWKVEYAQGYYGYCHADYITTTGSSPATVNTQSSGLNIRSGPGTGYTKLGALPKGRVVLILDSANGWSRILYSGTRTGYVSSRYLAASQQYSALQLAVPSFQQTDSRWANTYIGSSGKTIRQIGCATTAIAMIESYRRDTLLYPDAMARQLRYTPSGSVYWPEDYRVSSNSNGLLAAIYGYLQAGRPVLLGAKNTSGKQHWVVVTGFAGGSNLNTAGFVIEDPGSGSRKNLQQFLDVYPVFYKYFTYP